VTSSWGGEARRFVLVESDCMKNDLRAIPDAEWQGPRDTAWKAIQVADYRKAIGILERVYRKYPKDNRVISFYASTLADYGYSLPPARQEALRKRACILLKGLLTRLRGANPRLAYSARNEYYYHSRQHDKQYRLGVEIVQKGNRHAYYSQGVGAAWHAYPHAKAGRWYLARLWARRAVLAWESLFKFHDKYYNSYVHYALALGILGRTKEMEAALARSARLSGKPKTYREFTEVRDKIAELDVAAVKA